MNSKLFDLDIMHPRGWGEFGQDGDTCEHGHQVTEEDIENLRKHHGVETSYHTINGNKYRLISLLHKDATDTIVSLLGGDGKYYIINSNELPNGLIMPFFEHCLSKKLNFVIVDPGTALYHAWASRIGALYDSITDEKKNYVLVQEKKQVSSQILKEDKDEVIKKLSMDTTQSRRIYKEKTKSKILQALYREKNFFINYLKNPKKKIRQILDKAQLKLGHYSGDVIIFMNDFKNILEYIRNTTNTHIWIMGHCSSAVLVAIIYDCDQYNHLYKGMIFLNPWWKKNWREKGLTQINYFSTKVTKPLLIIQHAEDPCAGTSPEIAKKIISDIDSPLARYSELNGGIDQGCPHFSVGYHGFRGIEHKVIDEINSFLLDNGKM